MTLHVAHLPVSQGTVQVDTYAVPRYRVDYGPAGNRGWRRLEARLLLSWDTHDAGQAWTVLYGALPEPAAALLVAADGGAVQPVIELGGVLWACEIDGAPVRVDITLTGKHAERRTLHRHPENGYLTRRLSTDDSEASGDRR